MERGHTMKRVTRVDARKRPNDTVIAVYRGTKRHIYHNVTTASYFRIRVAIVGQLANGDGVLDSMPFTDGWQYRI